jgi:glucan phosphoethanolaminetransferase (alkaline phosphatase superfamily)
MKNLVKVLLIVLFLAVDYQQYLARLTTLSALRPAAAVIYVGLFAVLAVSLLSAAFIANGFLRWLVAIGCTASAAFFHNYVDITGDFLTYDAFVSQIDAFSFVDEALHHYLPSILRAAAVAFLLLLGLGLRPDLSWFETVRRNRFRAVGLVPIGAPVLGVLVLTAILFVRGGEGARGLPVMFTTLAYVNLLVYENLTTPMGPREQVRLARQPAAIRHDIVLIVDESISGNYLDLNAAEGVPTPLTKPPAGVAVYNYGYAAAITNCSAGVNVTLRFGGTRQDYVRINARMPSLWQYGKAAGLRTIYIDAQRTHRMLINQMTEQELEHIDRWIQFDDVSVRDRDMAVAATLVTLFNDSTPQLIYVNKMGAHFPVHDKAPDHFVRYRPALARGNYRDVADIGTASRQAFGGTAADWLRYRNSYRNTLLWVVSEFFTRVFASGHLNAVIIYTSDHGQDLHERGGPGLNTHCGDNPELEEGLVPLVAIQGASLKTPDWATHLAQNRHRSSHFNIFPTLLQLMGYDLEGIRAVYGNPLTIPTNDPFTFNSRFNARLGAKPHWEFIDLRRIVTPPCDSVDCRPAAESSDATRRPGAGEMVR